MRRLPRGLGVGAGDPREERATGGLSVAHRGPLHAREISSPRGVRTRCRLPRRWVGYHRHTKVRSSIASSGRQFAAPLVVGGQRSRARDVRAPGVTCHKARRAAPPTTLQSASGDERSPVVSSCRCQLVAGFGCPSRICQTPRTPMVSARQTTCANCRRRCLTPCGAQGCPSTWG